MEKTKTNLIAWNGMTYDGMGKWFDKISEHFEDLDHDERLILAVYAWNCAINGTDLDSLKQECDESFAGEFMSTEEFTKDLLLETGILPADLPEFVVIDWQGTWDTALRHDYFEYDVIDIDGNHRRFFWNAY